MGGKKRQIKRPQSLFSHYGSLITRTMRQRLVTAYPHRIASNMHAGLNLLESFWAISDLTWPDLTWPHLWSFSQSIRTAPFNTDGDFRQSQPPRRIRSILIQRDTNSSHTWTCRRLGTPYCFPANHSSESQSQAFTSLTFWSLCWSYSQVWIGLSERASYGLLPKDLMAWMHSSGSPYRHGML